MGNLLWILVRVVVWIGFPVWTGVKLIEAAAHLTSSGAST